MQIERLKKRLIDAKIEEDKLEEELDVKTIERERVIPISHTFP